MKIVVLLKQTPDTEAKMTIHADGKSIEMNGVKKIVNPYDEFAIEEALKIKQNIGAGEVIIASFGSPDTKERILRGLAMGADRGILISHEGLENCDAFVVSKVLSELIKSENAELVLCGKQAIDDDNMHVIGMTAEFLDWPHINVVSKVDVSEKKARVEREVEGGQIEVYEVELPVILGANKSLNSPRYASVPGIMKAKKKPFEMKKPQDYSLDINQLTSESKTEFVAFEMPPEKPAGKLFKDEPVEVMVDQVVKLLREEAKIL